MTSNEGIAFISSGAVAGASLSATLGNVGLVGGFGGVSLGIGTVTGAGAIAGAAIYGAFKAVEEGDATAIGAIGLGTLGGIGISTTVGGMGLGVAGGAVGIGMGSIAAMGGVVGLGIYGLANIFTQAEKQKNYYNNLIYLEQITREYEEEQLWHILETEAELKDLKEQILLEQEPVESQENTTTENINESILETQQELIWQCKSKLHAHTASINTLSINSDGKTLVSGSDDQTVKLWDIATGKHLYTFFGLGGEVQTVVFSPDGATLFTGGFDQRISAWQLKTKKIICSFFSLGTHYSHSGVISQITFTSDRKLLISASGDHSIRIWKANSGQWQQTLTGHSDIVWSIAITPNGKTLVSGSGDKKIRLWNLSNYNSLSILTGHTEGVMTLAISPNGHILASGSKDKTIKLWKLDTGELIQTLTGHTAGIMSLAISPDGRYLVSASHKEVIIWCLTTGRLLQELSGTHPIVFSPNGQVLVSGSDKKYLKIWILKQKGNNLTIEPNFSEQWWEILGVTKSATSQEVKLAYHYLARRYHPDLNKASSAIAYMQAINAAYEQFLQEFAQTLI